RLAAPRRAESRGRRRAARPAARRRDREHVEGRVPLGGPALALADARRGLGRGAAARARGGPPDDARRTRRGAAAAQGVPARWPGVPALRHADPLVSAGGRCAQGVLVPGLPERRETASGVGEWLHEGAPSLRLAPPL